MSSSHKLVKRAGFVSAATLISRILGYVRDALVAGAFGGGQWTDAFYAAFRIPNLLRRILGEGPLTSAFVPLFSERLTKDRESAEVFFQKVFTALAVVLSVAVAVGILFAPQITHFVAWGFRSDPEKFNLTAQLTRTMFPFVLFVCLAAVAAGALNSLHRFFLPALAPAMLSVAEIAFILFFASLWKGNPLRGMSGLAMSAVAGGFLHFAVLVPLLLREKIFPRWNWDPEDREVLRVGTALLPAVWGLSVDQINAFLDTVCASFLSTGSVTALYNSNRLMQFPLALIGVAMSTAALPSLSVSAAKNDFVQMKETLNFALRQILFLILPAMGGLMVLCLPIVALLFQHGNFEAKYTALTGSALFAYSLGLPAYGTVKILANSFYSLKDTRTPVRVATYCLLVNMAGNAAFMWKWGAAGLAFATALASYVNAGVLFYFLRRRLGVMGGRRILKTFWQSLSAAMIMGVVVAVVNQLSSGRPWIGVPSAVFAGIAAYSATAWILKMEELFHLWNLLRKKPGPPPL